MFYNVNIDLYMYVFARALNDVLGQSPTFNQCMYGNYKMHTPLLKLQEQNQG